MSAKKGPFRNETEGPIAGHAWPEKLIARLTTPDESRVAGYTTAELSDHVCFTDMIYLALAGELPTARVSRVFEYVLMHLAPVSVARASAHAAVLTRVCDATSAATAGVAAMGTAEEARFELERFAPLLAWCTDRGNAFPLEFTANGDSERVAEIYAGLSARGITLDVPKEIERYALLVLALVAVGISDPASLEYVWFVARAPFALAEARLAPARSFREYPMKTPRFEYVEQP